MSNYKFPKEFKLASKSDFKAVFDYKLFARNDLMTVYMSPNGLEMRRFAVSISAKAAPAVLRNRLKRIAREAFRLSQYDLPASFDYLIIYSRLLSKRQNFDIKAIGLAQVRQGFTELAARAYKRYEARQK